jgi:protein involved in polysaccharide export with SLBB domain
MSYRTAFVPLIALVLLLAACSTPSVVPLPSSDLITARDAASLNGSLSKPLPVRMRVQAGDILRITRDVPAAGETEEMNLYTVRNDGGFSYPFIGRVEAAGKTPEAIGDYMTEKLKTVYREPNVSVNIKSAAGNQVFVGGAVRAPAAYDLRGVMSIEQAVLTAGGVLPSADSEHIALLRQNDDGKYDVYFHNFSALLQPVAGGRPSVPLQRGDIVFVPKSGIGNAVEGIDMYVNQLLPFSRSFGISVNYGNTSTTIK